MPVNPRICPKGYEYMVVYPEGRGIVKDPIWIEDCSTRALREIPNMPIELLVWAEKSHCITESIEVVLYNEETKKMNAHCLEAM